MHWIPAVQHVLQNVGRCRSARVPSPFHQPKDATEHAIALNSQHRTSASGCLMLFPVTDKPRIAQATPIERQQQGWRYNGQKRKGNDSDTLSPGLETRLGVLRHAARQEQLPIDYRLYVSGKSRRLMATRFREVSPRYARAPRRTTARQAQPPPKHSSGQPEDHPQKLAADLP